MSRTAAPILSPWKNLERILGTPGGRDRIDEMLRGGHSVEHVIYPQDPKPKHPKPKTAKKK